MTSTSKSQQKLFGWALACKRGKTKNRPSNVVKLAESLSESELEKYASDLHESFPEAVTDAVVECISEMDKKGLDLLEKETKKEKATPKKKVTDEPAVAKDVKTPSPTDDTPEPPPGYVKADKRKDPGFFTPSLFKRPGDAKAKSDRRLMDFGEFQKRTNYQTHDGILQKGHGSNLRGKGNT